MEIKEVTQASQKSALAAEVLADLPEWFGIPESTQAYIAAAAQLQFWAAYEGEEPLGFVSLSYSSPDCAEIDCLAVKRAYHGQGIGARLVKTLEDRASQRVPFLQVKTVAPGHFASYDRTNAFYQALGFKKLEVFPELWHPDHPCLIWIKGIS